MKKNMPAGFVETFLSRDSQDIRVGFLFLIAGGYYGLANYRLGILVGVAIGLFFLGIVVYELLAGESREAASDRSAPREIKSTLSAPVTDEPTLADKIKEIHARNDFKCPACGAVTLPTDMKCRHCGSVLVESVNLPEPFFFGAVQVGQVIRIQHPAGNEIDRTVEGRVYYGELWQERMQPDVPWTLTGNYFVGLALDGDDFLLNWQSRFYFLESHAPISDSDINLHFARPARKFAASDQTAEVQFTYANEPWKIDDIGRFRIEYNEGGSRAAPGAAGRFIHASHFNRALVVEDYQSGGGGLDARWTGYVLTEKDIKL